MGEQDRTLAHLRCNRKVEKAMSRPTYETAQDRENEEKIINDFKKFIRSKKPELALNHHKLPKKYKIDFALTYQDMKHVYAFVEAKRRNVTKDEYPWLILSLDKFYAMQSCVGIDIKAFLVFEFNDGTFFIDMKRFDRPRVVINGRKDRNDPDDIEPVVCITRDMWRVVETS